MFIWNIRFPDCVLYFFSYFHILTNQPTNYQVSYTQWCPTSFCSYHLLHWIHSKYYLNLERSWVCFDRKSLHLPSELLIILSNTVLNCGADSIHVCFYIRLFFCNFSMPFTTAIQLPMYVLILILAVITNTVMFNWFGDCVKQNIHRFWQLCHVLSFLLRKRVNHVLICIPKMETNVST